MFSGLGLRNYCAHVLRGVLALTAAISLLPWASSRADEIAGISVANLQAANELFDLAEYGEIVYQKNGHCPQQIFIVGQSHRSALTGLAGSDTVKIQTEIYRIGEWLIREKNVGLLLPEGFFQRTPNENVSLAEAARETIRLDNQTLVAELSDTRRFVNADMLLNTSYNIPLGQVEDEQLYRDIRLLLREARQENSLSVLSKLAGLQDERTAALLQNIPEVVEEAFRTGRIDNLRAMFTIGLAHVGEIINILQNGSLRLPPAKSGLAEGEMSETTLKLLDQGYGVTVIIPRTLAENKHTLRLAKLETE
jgi:hypothetical protein